MMNIITKYFPNLSECQKEQFAALGPLYSEWNQKINVISRKDIDNLYPNHILHSLGIAKFTDFKDGSDIIDIGTGGGFPGIPLAIMFPKVHFLLVDRTGKKIKVASNVAESIGLTNVELRQADVAEIKQQFDFAISRAVMNLPQLVDLTKKHIKKDCRNSIPNGLICLKGGDLGEETKRFNKSLIVTELSTYFEEEFFETKKVVYVSL